MEDLTLGLSLLSLTSLVLLLVAWRRNLGVQRALVEPRLVNAELLRLLANSYAAAKFMLESCPQIPENGAEFWRRLSLAVAAVDEFARSSDGHGLDP